MRTRLLQALGPLAFLAATGCQNATESPTAPAAEPSTAIVAAASALVLRDVSAGNDHTCGVTSANLAYCWGGNWRGQLGDGTRTLEPWLGRPVPAPVSGGLRFRSVSAGLMSTCGVTTAYQAYCWGMNQFGELGDGTTTDRLKPVRVLGGLSFRQVTSGNYHRCGIGYSDSLAYCWGNNGDGQLGDRTRVDHLKPAHVFGGLRWRQLSAGGTHTCGITTDKRLYCWGRNDEGQLGDSTEVTRRLWPVRVAAGTRKFQQVSAGYRHTCASSTANTAFCWGNGRTGALGNGKTYLSFWPRAVAGGRSFEMVSAGALYTCGKTPLDQVYCWGRNSQGNLGDGTTTDRLTPVSVAGTLALDQVSAGAFHTCGRTATGTGYCWGGNTAGQLGDGTTTRRLRPVAIARPM